jgi:threonine dehydrogenase-like Zn-dependent dehydrogenase
MRALTFQAPEEISLQRVEDPTILSNRDVILRVDCAGICGSDLHVFHGREVGLDGGTVMGHEVVGTVVAKGSEVSRLHEEDRVVAPFSTNCGACYFCPQGLTARCENGRLLGWVEGGEGLHGAQAEYIRIPWAESTLVRVPSDLPSSRALLAGDVLATGLFASELGGVKPGSRVAVLGCGAVGLMAIVGALRDGAEVVYAVDPLAERRRRAENFGAVSLDLGAAVSEVLEHTEGHGVDCVLEAVGSPSATRAAYQMLRLGGTLAAVGVHTEPRLDISPAELYDKNLTYRTGRCSARRLVESALDLLVEARLPFESVVSHVLPLDQGVAAYGMFARREAGCSKVILEP